MPCLNSLINLLHKKWAVLIAWQIVSLLLCGGGTLCSFISYYYQNTIPLLMMAIGYTLLLFVSCRNVPKTDIAWRRYLVVALLLVAGDYSGIKAYNTTSLASAMLLVTTVSFWVAPIAWFVLKRKITLIQFFAILLGIGGSGVIFVADGVEGNKWVGNILALISAITYAFGTVFQEYLVHNDSVHIYIFRFACGAAPFAWALSGPIEWKLLRDFHWCWQSVLLILGYAFLLVIYNLCSPSLMQFSDATTMNLSILTSNFYSLGISIIAFGQKPSYLYLIGFLCVPIAIIIYTLAEPKTQEASTDMQTKLKNDKNTQYDQTLDNLSNDDAIDYIQKQIALKENDKFNENIKT